MPDIVAKLADLGLEPVGGSPDELARFQKAEIQKWAKVVKEANVKPE
jgi:tripartite-type tricarboxylate transporter receptor subunit TctC